MRELIYLKIIDISMTIQPDMAVYKNKPEKKPALNFTQDFSNGDSCESEIKMGMHTGTHVDAPLHMLRSGAAIEKISLDKVVRPCRVLDFTVKTDRITAQDLEFKNIKPGDFLLLKTSNSFDAGFNFNFIFLDSSGAAYVKDKGVAGVGIDALGIERDQPGHPTHKILFEAGIIILEGLRLADVEEGDYFLCAAPLKIAGAESAPARAFLIKPTPS